ncbi:energy-coupling factor ABC transporter ATP-binding protein [Bryobacter aggregatus]|uniref:energy-coupling factor ABC transporter ATP-binding protein n=1 Tax=Bryobacter aggregatus TaxID=360054 RepID=UPI00055C133A|nr:ABC transporter ATP-binding protein [Bryobacter aggregatus]
MIQVRDLCYEYADSGPILRGIHFTQAPGESVALLGPNGSGKTTFALHLNGILQGVGEVVVCGIRVAPETLEQVRRKVGFVFQSSENQLFLPTVLEDVMFGLLNQGVSVTEARPRAEAMLESLHLTPYADRNPFHLSAGEKRRAALAGVLLMEPEVLILDEPTTFLDPPGIRELSAMLRKLEIAQLIITHDSRFALETTTRAVFFEKGQIAAEGSTQEIIDRFDWL